MCRRFKIESEDSRHLEVYDNLFLDKGMDIKVGEKAYGIVKNKDAFSLSCLTFGFRCFDSSLVYNARNETVLEKNMFRLCFQNKAVFPCTSFYEKGKDGNEHEFLSDGKSLLYLCGFYNDENRFVLLTERSSCPLSFYHPRMPILIGKEEVSRYLENRYDFLNLSLRKRPSIHQRGDWVQLSLFD